LRRWFNWIALVIVFSIACGFLANWQFARRETKLASIELVRENYSKPAVAIADFPLSSQSDISKYIWRQVSMTGSYLGSSSLLVRNRPNNGQPGFEQLVPFKSTDDTVFFVSRGWIPSGSKQDLPDLVPSVPSGEITLVGRILASEPLLNRGAPVGQIASIHIPLAEKLVQAQSVESGYLRLVSENSKYPRALKPMPSPSVEEGNNLSYALQWILFAVMAASALIWRIRRDSQIAQGVVKIKKRTQSDLDAAAED